MFFVRFGWLLFGFLGVRAGEGDEGQKPSDKSSPADKLTGCNIMSNTNVNTLTQALAHFVNDHGSMIVWMLDFYFYFFLN